jgi:ubiquinone/menaquinone biosynthesis C-methylase UbiE|tara:strand:+ start:77 stop:706 length:630 start_codon:yes stop_codon:yes gene_type:complete
MDKIKSTKEFYKKLKTEGMSKLMTKERDKSYLQFLKSHLKKEQKILDLACGYGRLTIPLAKAKYNIEGIDLAPNFIKDAKAQAKEKNLKVPFKVGNMLELPYGDESFDVIICMWSSFNHLLTSKDQIKGLQEMLRILKKDGYAIIDMPSYKIINGKHLVKGNIGGFENVDFIHNRNSLSKIIKYLKIKHSKIKIENIGDRKRLVLYINK